MCSPCGMLFMWRLSRTLLHVQSVRQSSYVQSQSNHPCCATCLSSMAWPLPHVFKAGSVCVCVCVRVRMFCAFANTLLVWDPSHIATKRITLGGT